jgi:hypothetical protein
MTVLPIELESDAGKIQRTIGYHGLKKFPLSLGFAEGCQTLGLLDAVHDLNGPSHQGNSNREEAEETHVMTASSTFQTNCGQDLCFEASVSDVE